MPDVVPRHILAMLDKLDGKPAIRTAMIADAQALDDRSRPETEGGGFRQDIRLEVSRCHSQ
jgi:hypothetical protein